MNGSLDKDESRRVKAAVKAFLRHYGDVFCFGGGFLFDAFTLDRIDSNLDLFLQALYLAGLTLVLALQKRESAGRWTPEGVPGRLWRYNVEALHFLFGGLLSAYVIFYTRSGVNGRTAVFFAAAFFLLVYNEMPQAKRWGASLRSALFAFCAASFSIYLVPVLAGKMSDGIFLVSLLAAAGLCGLAFAALAWAGGAEGLRGPALSAAGVLLGVGGLYFARLIPPVPLAMKFAGIYHKVERRGEHFLLTYEKGPWHAVFRKMDRPFYAAPGDRLYCFVRVFAPTRFRHEIRLRWLERPQGGRDWIERDLIPLPIRGGREAGYRGYAYKAKYEPGDWLVRVETEDGRVLGKLPFKVLPAEPGPRAWAAVRM